MLHYIIAILYCFVMALNAFYGTLTCYSTSYCDSVRDIAITKRSISFVCLQRNNKWVCTLLLSLFLRSALLGVLSFMTNGEVKRYRDLDWEKDDDEEDKDAAADDDGIEKKNKMLENWRKKDKICTLEEEWCCWDVE